MEAFSALLALCVGNSPVPVNSPHRGQWRGALMFSLICARIKDWVNNREAGDLRRHHGHYDVNVMNKNVLLTLTSMCLYIYMHIDPYVLCVSICICIWVISILFNWFHYLCPRRTWSLALYFGKQYCTKMLHCYLFPCTLFWQLSIVKWRLGPISHGFLPSLPWRNVTNFSQNGVHCTCFLSMWKCCIGHMCVVLYTVWNYVTSWQ